MHKKIYLFVLFFFSSSAFAGWEANKKVDKMTDEVTIYAGVNAKNNNAHFWIYDGSENATAGLRLLGGFEQIHYSPKQITLRIDNKKARKYKITSWEPKLVFFNIPYDAGLLDELMDGSKMLLQYHSSEYQTKTLEFPLKGSTKAIRTAIPDYVRLDVRNKKETEEMQQQWREQAKNSRGDVRSQAQTDCPDELAEVDRIEQETGRPQMFRGCSAW